MTLVRSLHSFVLRFAPGLLSWRRVAAALLIVVASSIAWAPALRTIFTPTGDLIRQIREHFNNGAAATATPLEVNGFFACTDGWCLMPGASGTLTYRFVAEDDGFPSLVLWHYLPPTGTNRVSVSVDGRSPQVISENDTQNGRWLDLGRRVSRGQTVALIFEANNTSQNQALVLDQLLVEYRTATMPAFPREHTVFLIVLSFGLAVTVLCRNWPLALSTTLILAFGTQLRYDRAVNLLFHVLEPDAFMYRRWADSMRLFTDTGFFSAQFGVREPGYIFAIHVSQRPVRQFRFRASVCCASSFRQAYIRGTIRVVRKLWGIVVGQFSGLLDGVERAARHGGGARSPSRDGAGALPGVFLSRLRAGLVAPVGAGDDCLLGGWRDARRDAFDLHADRPRAGRLRGVSQGGLEGGRRQRADHGGDAGRGRGAAPLQHVQAAQRRAFDTNAYARYNANFEFAGRPGFPTVAQLQADGFIGPPITYSQYMLGMHTPGNWWRARRAATGSSIATEVAPWGIENKTAIVVVNAVFQLLAAAGMLVALWKREYLWILFAFVVFEFPVSFL